MSKNLEKFTSNMSKCMSNFSFIHLAERALTLPPQHSPAQYVCSQRPSIIEDNDWGIRTCQIDKEIWVAEIQAGG